MKSVNKKIIIISLILSLVITLLIYRYLKSINNENKKVEYIEIIVASKDINEREKITNNMIKKIKVVKDSYISNSIQNKEEIIGMYSKEKIFKGEVIPKDRLFESNNLDLTLKVPLGKRAISIMINEMSGASDLIKPGDYVDVYVTFDEYTLKTTETVYPKETQLLLQNILVLAISKEQERTDKNREEIPSVYPVTLAVTPSEGQKLVFSEEMGSIKLALRPLEDKSIYELNGIIRSDF